MSWEEQLEHIKAIRAQRRKREPPKAASKKLTKAILALSQEQIEGLRRVLQDVRVREAAKPTQLPFPLA